jgi:hypothetical protein
MLSKPFYLEIFQELVDHANIKDCNNPIIRFLPAVEMEHSQKGCKALRIEWPNALPFILLLLLTDNPVHENISTYPAIRSQPDASYCPMVCNTMAVCYDLALRKGANHRQFRV